MRGLIARRAYELFEARGRFPGGEEGDWLKAEAELLAPIRHELKETGDAIRFRAELPGDLAPEQIQVSVEPRRVIVSAESKVRAIRGDERTNRTERYAQRLFHARDLPAEVDPARTSATLRGNLLEIVMPRAARKPKP